MSCVSMIGEAERRTRTAHPIPAEKLNSTRVHAHIIFWPKLRLYIVCIRSRHSSAPEKLQSAQLLLDICVARKARLFIRLRCDIQFLNSRTRRNVVNEQFQSEWNLARPKFRPTRAATSR